MAIALQSCAAFAESAVLECISSKHVEAKGDGTTFYQFRMSAAPGWTISRASLLLHTTGTVPKSVEVGLAVEKWNEFDAKLIPVAGKMRKYDATELKLGWIRIELEPAQAQQIVHGLAVKVAGAGKAMPFHLRESMQYSPYLLLEGTSQ